MVLQFITSLILSSLTYQLDDHDQPGTLALSRSNIPQPSFPASNLHLPEGTVDRLLVEGLSSTRKWANRDWIRWDNTSSGASKSLVASWHHFKPLFVRFPPYLVITYQAPHDSSFHNELHLLTHNLRCWGGFFSCSLWARRTWCGCRAGMVECKYFVFLFSVLLMTFL